MKLTLGFSPCPNDCFIFDALLHDKIDTEGIRFDVVMEDVEALNKKATNSVLDVTKLSFHAFAYLTNQYVLLNSGSALGFNCGPLLISKKELSQSDLNSPNTRVAIPGKLTTANLLLSIAFPLLNNKKEILFSEIESTLLQGNCDAGLIIHETRFTYEEKGLLKVVDLGEFWESLIHSPIPLGGIFIRNNFDLKLQKTVDRIIRRSIEFAFSNPESSAEFISQNSQEMSREVCKKHIDLYVNDFSLELGETGIDAVKLLLNKSVEIGLIKDFNPNFVVQ